MLGMRRIDARKTMSRPATEREDEDRDDDRGAHREWIGDERCEEG